MRNHLHHRYSTVVVAGLSSLLLLASVAHGQNAIAVETGAQATSAPASQPAPIPAGLIGARADQITAQAALGTWTGIVAGNNVTLTLRPDRTYAFENVHGAYEFKGNQLVLSSVAGRTTYTFVVNADDNLVLSGGDLRADATFTRQANFVAYLASFTHITPQTLQNKARNIVVIVAVVITARVIIMLLNLVSLAFVSLNRGRFSILFSKNKARVRTLHSIFLNAVKYVVYFSALGFVLSELGVNYTTYLASLSVLGLAIGVGSQGLVQDMVTGFFVIFENQFDVGDMIDISGQTGQVVELGLRATRLRNYLGQEIIVPNRNIGVVGNYAHAAQLATVDVAISDAQAAAKGCKIIEDLAEELRRQFAGVITEKTAVEGLVDLKTGEHFIRLHLSFWPGQTWIIDQQLIPRTLELFKAAAIDVPSGRIAVFYLPRADRPVTDWRDVLSRQLPWMQQE